MWRDSIHKRLGGVGRKTELLSYSQVHASAKLKVNHNQLSTDKGHRKDVSTNLENEILHAPPTVHFEDTNQIKTSIDSSDCVYNLGRVQTEKMLKESLGCKDWALNLNPKGVSSCARTRVDVPIGAECLCQPDCALGVQVQTDDKSDLISGQSMKTGITPDYFEPNAHFSMT